MRTLVETCAEETGHVLMDNCGDHLARVRELVERMLRQGAVAPADAHLVVLAVDEAVSNVIEHAYAPGAEGLIELSIRVTGGTVCVVLRDWGVGFDPAGVPDVDIRAHVREGRPRGLGLLLMRRIMDTVRHERHDGCNELTLEKRLRKE